ncbi:hypothetical protein H6M51_15615 [Rhizobium sp. AQ_MP]|uniref:hypothetical protein n=1 Tax=Rhizobium sp. AQ_MP TaxID=2761536 RepID=UPI001639A7AF|nr:hypothetical protein [Rhizobium sp. AQ_MP]MBC2774292.1 hypothetical protein [Rhizobium sp. AQ_MP]
MTRTLAGTVGLLLLLSGCNSPDVLTPRADVGSGLGSLPPAYQQELVAPASPRQPVQSAPLSEPGFADTARGPQNTLEAQAAALAQGGGNPVASAPLDGMESQSFPESPQQQPARQVAQTAAQTSAPPAAQQAALPPAAQTTGSIRFLPIIGAPVQAVTPLSRQLGAEARARGLTIKSASDASSEHILKGYFSAFSDGGNVTITYVWDILDGSGGRLHRIQGQEIVPSGAQDPWAAVPASVMQQIATKSMAEYVSWRNSRAG